MTTFEYPFPFPFKGTRENFLQRRHFRIVQALTRFDLSEPSQMEKKIIRLDPISIFLILLATAVFIGILIAEPGYTDLVVYTQRYFLIMGLGAILALIGVGKYIYNISELAPITRPVLYGPKKHRNKFPDIALISIFVGFAAIGVTDYLITRTGFFPTLSFWTNLTPRMFYGAGGIYEEFVFRTVIYGTINRFFPYGIRNPAFSALFIAPLDSGIFTEYHIWAYANSKIALDMVFSTAYILNIQYRGTRYCLWAGMVLHAVNNILAPP